jgi:Fe-S cluster biogenesis protein NfuA
MATLAQPGELAAIEAPPRGVFAIQTDRVEKLAARLESTADPELRTTALDLVKSVIELHGSALTRLVDTLQRTPEGERFLAEALDDDLVSAMLLLHSLHPDPLETRVLRGVEKARLYLKSHGGDVEVLGVHDGTVRLRLHGTCGSCGSSSITLKNAVESAVFEAAPDVVEIICENVSAAAHNGPQLVTIR